jgi:hypothetical protein
MQVTRAILDKKTGEAIGGRSISAMATNAIARQTLEGLSALKPYSTSPVAQAL